MKKSILVLSLSIVILAMAITGATLAWLQDTTDPVVNTFTEGKVDIELYEHAYSAAENKLTDTKIYGDADADNEGNTYKMVPGDVLPKDPTIEVMAASEACWLFVKVEKTNNVDTFLKYTMATDWNLVPGQTNVYYQEVADTDAVQTFEVLKDNQVTVNAEVGMDKMNALNESNYPQLKFTAYAIQSANIKDENSNGTAADDAWAAMSV